MSHAIIEARGLGKRYRVGERERYMALRDVIARAFQAPFRRWQGRSADHLWAVRDVSFDVRQGEVVGLIGRNGAGKSTLLKLLSRITRPTKGYAEIRGRVGSLLEVGTGFHPELTGRENVYLSGAILGMKRAEIVRKFDEIVSFADVERFIDTPLKHYSSGMQMRLAFAVAAHLEPEILLIDEVLAVGDLAFQRKCLGKMEEVSKGGRTIVFVSHQMNQIRRLCERVFWLEHGQVKGQGRTGEMIASYEAAILNGSGERNPSGNRSVFQHWELAGGGNTIRSESDQVSLDFGLHLPHPVRRGHFGIHIYNDANILVASWGFDDVSADAGEQQLRVTIPYFPVRPGIYSITCSLYHDGNNLNGGSPLEFWSALPMLFVDVLPLSHPQDAWAGILNVPATLDVCPAVASPEGSAK